MTLKLATYDSSRTDRMSTRAAAGKLSWRQRVDAYVTASYGHDSKPLCIEDIRVALKAKSNVVKNAIAMLILRGNVRCVGMAENADRRDIGAKTKLYAPSHAPLLPAFVAKNEEISAEMTAKARAAADRRYLLNTEPPRAAVRSSPAYLGRPGPLSEPRVKQEPYKGEVAQKYVRPWPVSGEDTGRKPSEFWSARDLALTQR